MMFISQVVVKEPPGSHTTVPSWWIATRNCSTCSAMKISPALCGNKTKRMRADHVKEHKEYDAQFYYLLHILYIRINFLMSIIGFFLYKEILFWYQKAIFDIKTSNLLYKEVKNK